MKFEVPGGKLSKLRYIIEKIVMPKFPKIVEIDDIEYHLSSLGQERFFVHFITTECLTRKEQVEIYDLVRELFKAASFEDLVDKNKSQVRTYFDCGDGEGFVFRGW